MHSTIREIPNSIPPGTLVRLLRNEPGVVLLQSALADPRHGRYSFVAARPFLTFRSFGSRCEVSSAAEWSADFTPGSVVHVQFGDPWQVLDALMSRYELVDEIDLPFPLGGCFGCWGYDLKNFLEPKLPRRAANDLGLPDCHVGFYDSLVVFDHHLDKTWIVSTGLSADGTRSEERAGERMEFWQTALTNVPEGVAGGLLAIHRSPLPAAGRIQSSNRGARSAAPYLQSSFSRADFLDRVERAQRYIRAGDIYQVNLSQRLAARTRLSGWELFDRLVAVSPAPFAAYLDCGDFQIASSSPEMFLRLSGAHVQTRPIKGTRPRSADPARDAQLAWELQTSPKELAELVMITDLLRNDLGKVCDYGSVQVPDLVRLERYAQVQHLVSTVEGRLRPDVTHLAALKACFPGGSITGAPKFRAMEIIDELEPVTRGPYTGALGYLGFNRESQLSIIIRTAICRRQTAYFQVGAGIVADSQPEAEYDETLAKARGFLAALGAESPTSLSPQPTSRPVRGLGQVQGQVGRVRHA